jgi:RNA-directed DNA polymerase
VGETRAEDTAVVVARKRRNWCGAKGGREMDGVMEMRQEEQLAGVPEAAKQAGEVRKRWAWTEPDVWTERMLITLEDGVKGGVWFSLADKVQSKKNLTAAAEKVLRNKGAAGIDRVSTEHYARRLEANLEELHREMREGRYRPQAVRRVMSPKGRGKERPLGIPTVKDRVAQTALKQVLEPIFEREFMPTSYGFRPGRGCKQALKAVDELMRDGYVWVVDADIKSYFDSIPHEKLMERIRERVADGRVLDMVTGFLNQGVMDGMKEWTPEEGTPQGAVISPLLANIYLNPFDRQMSTGEYRMVRYADDFVIMCRTQEDAQEAMKQVEGWMAAAGLKLSEEKTRIVNMGQEGQWIEFLGYHLERNKSRILRWPRKKSLNKMMDAIRERTRRCNGHGISHIIPTVNSVLRGWFGYYKQSHWTTFGRIDRWVRMRLRSVLRKHAGRRGIGHGWDNIRWPNAYFEAEGLFSLDGAYQAIVSPRTR